MIHPRAAVMRCLPTARLFFSCIRQKSSVLTADEARATSLMKQIISLVLEPVALGLRRSDMDALIKDGVMYVRRRRYRRRFRSGLRAAGMFGVTEEAKRFASAAGRGQ